MKKILLTIIVSTAICFAIVIGFLSVINLTAEICKKTQEVAPSVTKYEKHEVNINTMTTSNKANVERNPETVGESYRAMVQELVKEISVKYNAKATSSDQGGCFCFTALLAKNPELFEKIICNNKVRNVVHEHIN